MIKKAELDQIDQLLEDTFPKGSIPPNHPPNDAKASAGTTALASASTFTGAAPALAALVSMPRADQLVALGKMRERVELLREEMMREWAAIDASWKAQGKPDFDQVQDHWIAFRKAMRRLDDWTYEEFLNLRP